MSPLADIIWNTVGVVVLLSLLWGSFRDWRVIRSLRAQNAELRAKHSFCTCSSDVAQEAYDQAKTQFERVAEEHE